MWFFSFRQMQRAISNRLLQGYRISRFPKRFPVPFKHSWYEWLAIWFSSATFEFLRVIHTVTLLHHKMQHMLPLIKLIGEIFFQINVQWIAKPMDHQLWGWVFCLVERRWGVYFPKWQPSGFFHGCSVNKLKINELFFINFNFHCMYSDGKPGVPSFFLHLWMIIYAWVDLKSISIFLNCIIKSIVTY